MKLLTQENYTQLQPWVEKYGWREYNSNIVTMLMWNKTYPIYFKIYDHYALVCFEYDNKKHWLMPYSEKAYLKEAIDTLLDYSIKHDIPCQIHGTTKEAKDCLETLFPMQVYFEHHERAEDYIYDRSQQETLVGKKMQKRRNHFNAFLKEYGNRYTYHTIQKEDFPHILTLLEKWQNSKEEEAMDSIKREEDGIHYLLQHYDSLHLTGICIYIDGVLEAFNIASYISEDMVQVHIEKANRDIRGLYVAVCKFLLSTLDSKVLYINREDDMGNTSLQKAKKDMKPLYKVKKHLTVFEKLSIHHPTQKDYKEMKDLWLSSFEDENEATCEYFFTNIMSDEDAYILSNEHEIMGMAFVNRWKMSFHKEVKEIAFIEGVCTKKVYQGCGVMKKLMHHILDVYKDMPLALQAYNWDLYRSFAFKETHYLKQSVITEPLEEEITFCQCNPSIMENIYKEYTQNKDLYRIHDKDYYENLEVCGYTTLQYEDKGYVSFYVKEESVYVHCIHFKDYNSLYRMLATLQKMYSPTLIVNTDTQTPLSATSTNKIQLMMYPHIICENAYTNEII